MSEFDAIILARVTMGWPLRAFWPPGLEVAVVEAKASAGGAVKTQELISSPASATTLPP